MYVPIPFYTCIIYIVYTWKYVYFIHYFARLQMGVIWLCTTRYYNHDYNTVDNLHEYIHAPIVQ